MKNQTAQTAATATKANLHRTVTDRIIASLKEGIIPWEKPWQAPTYAGGNFPRNFRTGKPYRGVNVFLLWSTPYAAPFWLTFKQAQELGGTVRKGEKAQRSGRAHEDGLRVLPTDQSCNGKAGADPRTQRRIASPSPSPGVLLMASRRQLLFGWVRLHRASFLDLFMGRSI